MSLTLNVNIAEIRVAKSPIELVCLGIGSCIAVVLYDSEHKIGGLAHVMLPNSNNIISLTHPGKFADTAIPQLLKRMQHKGAMLESIEAKIFGGADMFSIGVPTKKTLGEANAKAVIQELEKLKIPLVAKDTGGCVGRSIFFSTENGRVSMRKIKEYIKKDF